MDLEKKIETARRARRYKYNKLRQLVAEIQYHANKKFELIITPLKVLTEQGKNYLQNLREYFKNFKVKEEEEYVNENADEDADDDDDDDDDDDEYEEKDTGKKRKRQDTSFFNNASVIEGIEKNSTLVM